MFALVKVVVSAIVIGGVTEVARRYPAFGGIIAALPLVSLLSLFWLYFQGEEMEILSKFIYGVLWGFPATAFLLLVIGLCLTASLPFIGSTALDRRLGNVSCDANHSIQKYIKFIWQYTIFDCIISQILL